MEKQSGASKRSWPGGSSSGVSFVTIDLSNHNASGTWDTHGDNIPPYGGIMNGLRPLCLCSTIS